MKSQQFFKIYKRFDKEREKTLIQQSMREEKLKKVGLCFITGYFIKPFKMTIIFDYLRHGRVKTLFFHHTPKVCSYIIHRKSVLTSYMSESRIFFFCLGFLSQIS